MTRPAGDTLAEQRAFSTASPARLAVTSDRMNVAAMLAAAFADDPAFSYIFPDPAVRHRLLPRVFALFFDSDGRSGKRFVVTTTGGAVTAASLWRAPGLTHVGWAEMLLHAVPLLSAFRGATWRALQVGNAVDAHHPGGDYWYLHILGRDPVRQGAGHGTAAVRAGLDAVPGGLPCYVETANQANLGFYRQLGFMVTGQWQVKGGGPTFWSMLRPPG